MIVFTVLGVFFFWVSCWQIGYHFAMYLDVRRGINAFFAPVENELTQIASLLAVFAGGQLLKKQRGSR